MDMWCFYFVSSRAVTKHFGNWIMKNLLWNTVQNLPLIACKPRQEKNVNIRQDFRGGGGGRSKEVTSLHRRPESRSVKLSDIAFKWNEFPNVIINGKERKGTFFSQSTMIHHIVSKNSLWYGELDFLPRWTTWRPGSEARWHFVLVFFCWRNLSFSWLTGEYHYPN